MGGAYWSMTYTIYSLTAKHALTKIAKSIVKICKEDVSDQIVAVISLLSLSQMREVELCPSCYSLTVKQPADWFCIPCVSYLSHSNNITTSPSLV